MGHIGRGGIKRAWAVAVAGAAPFLVSACADTKFEGCPELRVEDHNGIANGDAVVVGLIKPVQKERIRDGVTAQLWQVVPIRVLQNRSLLDRTISRAFIAVSDGGTALVSDTVSVIIVQRRNDYVPSRTEEAEFRLVKGETCVSLNP